MVIHSLRLRWSEVETVKLLCGHGGFPVATGCHGAVKCPVKPPTRPCSRRDTVPEKKETKGMSCFWELFALKFELWTLILQCPLTLVWIIPYRWSLISFTMSLTLIWGRREERGVTACLCAILGLQHAVIKINHWTKNTMASTHRQIILYQAEDDVGADEDPCTSNASAAVHGDGSLVVHRPQVADKANQLLRAVRDAVVGPVGELQVSDKVGLTALERQGFQECPTSRHTKRAKMPI